MRVSVTLMFACLAPAVLAKIPVYVMLPLDAINTDNTVNNPGQLQSNLQTLKNSGVTGVMGDVWWGIVEPSAKAYNFSGYIHLAEIIQSVGLTYEPVMSTHQCGGNVGDACNIPLPEYVQNAGGSPWYQDQDGNTDHEYISLFYDTKAMFDGRTPIQLYSGLYAAFRSAMSAYFSSGLITNVEISMGPAGELRYPSYQSSHWKFCGVGAFQCFDDAAKASLSAAANAAGRSDWSNPPNNAGDYNSHPSDTAFFSDNQSNNYASDYGHFFINWYAQALLSHADRVLTVASQAFSGVSISGKVAGIHWWYNTHSHAAEVTAGYYNTNQQNAYALIASVFAKHGAQFDFTCFEMKDTEQPSDCACGPQELVSQTKAAAKAAGIGYSGENALPRYDSTAYGTIEAAASAGGDIDSFAYLRLNPTLLQSNNLNTFTQFVRTMDNE